MKEYNENECCVFRKTKEQYGGLSNMAGAYMLNVNGIRILTAEALYQACRYPHLPDLQRVIINEKSPMAAKMKSKPYRKSDSRKDWEDVRVDIMFWCLKVKLAQNRIHFGTLLNSTMDKKIVEDSRNDNFWGAIRKKESKDLLVGENVLGCLLVDLRAYYLKNKGSEIVKKVEPLSIPEFKIYDSYIG